MGAGEQQKGVRWVKPKRTMSVPASLRGVYGREVPDVVDLLTMPIEVLKRERQHTGREPAAATRRAPPADDDAHGLHRRTAADSSTPQTSSNVSPPPPAAAAAATAEPRTDENTVANSAGCPTTADDLIAYPPSDFMAIGSRVAAAGAVEEISGMTPALEALASRLVSLALGGDTIGTPAGKTPGGSGRTGSPIPRLGSFQQTPATTPSGAGAAGLRSTGSTPFSTYGAAAALSAPRKRYFDHVSLSQRVIAVLNKVSADESKYHEVRKELLRLPLQTASEEEREKIAAACFHKAIDEPRFAPQYAKIIAQFTLDPPGTSTMDPDSTPEALLRRTLVSRCKQEYETQRDKLWAADLSASAAAEAATSDHTSTNGAPVLQEGGARGGTELEEEAHHRHEGHRFRETLRFVSLLFNEGILRPGVIRSVADELLPPPELAPINFSPGEFVVDGVQVLLLTAAPRLASVDPPMVLEALRRFRLLAPRLTGRPEVLAVNAVDTLTALAQEAGLHPPTPPPGLDDDDSHLGASMPLVPSNGPPPQVNPSVAHGIMLELAQSGDFERALAKILTGGDVEQILYHWIHRALTVVRADKERVQLPELLRFLVERHVVEFGLVRHLMRHWVCFAVDERLWESTPRLWQHWSQVLAEDKHPAPIVDIGLHNIALYEIATSTRFDQRDFFTFLGPVLAWNEQRAWDVAITGPVIAPRLRYVAHIVAATSYDTLEDEAVDLVRRLLASFTHASEEIEARLFLLLCEGNPEQAYDTLDAHPRRDSIHMVQKVMGAIVAAAMVLQSTSVVEAGVVLLQLVVDGPDRGLREALITSELMDSGRILYHHLRSNSFGFKVTRLLKNMDVISSETLTTALDVYAEDSASPDLLGPRPRTPFVSAPPGGDTAIDGGAPPNRPAIANRD